jgi:hypothetical protein
VLQPMPRSRGQYAETTGGGYLTVHANPGDDGATRWWRRRVDIVRIGTSRVVNYSIRDLAAVLQLRRNITNG